MKKIYSSLLFALVLSLLATTAFAYDAEIDGIYYKFYGNEALVTSGGDYSGNIAIPASVTYNGTTYRVTAIDDYAFEGCSSLISVTIGSGVTSIGNSAFALSSLRSITIPNSVTSIGNGAFGECQNLNSITIPNSVTSIGDGAFLHCYYLTSITIPESVTSIGKEAFSPALIETIVVADENSVYDSRNACNAIIETRSNTLIIGCNNTTIPNSVTSIGDYAFYGCNSLTSVIIPNSVTSIGYQAFYNCI